MCFKASPRACSMCVLRIHVLLMIRIVGYDPKRRADNTVQKSPTITTEQPATSHHHTNTLPLQWPPCLTCKLTVPGMLTNTYVQSHPCHGLFSVTKEGKSYTACKATPRDWVHSVLKETLMGLVQPNWRKGLKHNPNSDSVVWAGGRGRRCCIELKRF